MAGIWSAQPWGDNYAYQDIKGYLALFVLLLWAISPYLSLLFTLKMFSQSKRIFAAISTLVLALVLLSGYALYDTVFVQADAQNALIFIFLPIYQHGAIIILNLLGFGAETISKVSHLKKTNLQQWTKTQEANPIHS